MSKAIFGLGVPRGFPRGEKERWSMHRWNIFRGKVGKIDCPVAARRRSTTYNVAICRKTSKWQRSKKPSSRTSTGKSRATRCRPRWTRGRLGCTTPTAMCSRVCKISCGTRILRYDDNNNNNDTNYNNNKSFSKFGTEAKSGAMRDESKCISFFFETRRFLHRSASATISMRPKVRLLVTVHRNPRIPCTKRSIISGRAPTTSGSRRPGWAARNSPWRTFSKSPSRRWLSSRSAYSLSICWWASRWVTVCIYSPNCDEAIGFSHDTLVKHEGFCAHRSEMDDIRADFEGVLWLFTFSTCEDTLLCVWCFISSLKQGTCWGYVGNELSFIHQAVIWG